MPKLKRVSGQQAIRALEKLGFVQVRQRGSHVVLKKEDAIESVGCVVPLHRELAIGTIGWRRRWSAVVTAEQSCRYHLVALCRTSG